MGKTWITPEQKEFITRDTGPEVLTQPDYTNDPPVAGPQHPLESDPTENRFRAEALQGAMSEAEAAAMLKEKIEAGEMPPDGGWQNDPEIWAMAQHQGYVQDAPWWQRVMRGAHLRIAQDVDSIAHGVDNTAWFLGLNEDLGLGDYFTEHDIQKSVAEQWGVAPPEDGSTAASFENAGGWLADAALTAPLVGAAAVKTGIPVAKALAGEAIAAPALGFLEQEAANAGYPGTGAAVAGVGSLAAPGAASKGVGAAGTAVKTGIDALPYSQVNKLTRAPAAHMAKLGVQQGMPAGAKVSRRALVRGAQQARRMSPDPLAAADEMKAIQVTNKDLEEWQRKKFSDANKHEPWWEPGQAEADIGISVRQGHDSMGDNRGGAIIGALDEHLSTTDIDYAAKQSRRMANTSRAVRMQLEEMGWGHGDYAGLIDDLDESEHLARAAETDAWKTLDEAEDLPAFDIERVQKKIMEVTDKHWTDDQKAVPQILHDLINADKVPGADPGILGSDVPFWRFQEARSDLLAIVREGSSSGAFVPSKQQKKAALMAREVLEEMQLLIDDWEKVDIPEGMSEQYHSARTITRENKDLYDPDSPIYRIMTSGKGEKSFFQAMLRGGGRRGKRMTPADEARRVKKMLEPMGEKAQERLRHTAVDDLFDPLEGKTGLRERRPMNRLAANRDVYVEIFGEQHVADMERLLEIQTKSSFGKAGTAAQSVSAGAGGSGAGAKDIDPLLQFTTEVMGPIPGTRVYKWLSSKFDKMGVSSEHFQVDYIIKVMMDDPRMAELLFRSPVEPGTQAFILRWNQLLSRAGARSAAAGVKVDKDALTGRQPKTQTGAFD